MEQWQSAEVNEIAAAIVKAQKALKPVAKDCNNPFFKSKYADLSSVWPALAPFADNGIAITQSPMESASGQAVLDTQLTHSSGQWMRSRLTMPLAKNDPQGMGSALTYARRYALGCMTGLVTEEDDDGNHASQPATRTQAIVQNKQTAQAKINELRQEAAQPSLHEADVLPNALVQTDAPSTYKMKIGRQKGQLIGDVSDESLVWCLNYYLDKIRDVPDSRYRAEWEEAVLAIEEEKAKRA